MDGHDGLHMLENIAELLIVPENIFQINRHQTGLPVMAMDDIRIVVDDQHHGQDCLAEIGKLFQIPESVLIDPVP